MGFAVIYRWTVEPGHEANFRERWHAGTLRLRDQFGGLGSCLTRNDAGQFVAIALWRIEAARDAAFAARGPTKPWPGVVDHAEEKLWIEDDLWLVSAFPGNSARPQS